MVREEIRTDQIIHGRSASPLVRSRRDPSTYFGFCLGPGVPRVGDDLPERVTPSYTYCPVWELEKKRLWKRQEMMVEPRRPGMSEAAEAALIDGAVRDIDRGDAIQEWMAEKPRGAAA